MNSEHIRQMFDAISSRYDLMNTLISFGLHHRWRKEAVKWGNVQPGMRIIDLCTGTGDFIFSAAEIIHWKIQKSAINPAPVTCIIGLDFSENMLHIAEKKLQKRHFPAQLFQIEFVRGDVLHLPYPAESFHLATIGFGLRNLKDLFRGLTEIHRVLKPDGILLTLEASYPENPFILPFFHLYFSGIVPILGWLIAHNFQAYKYLPQSARTFHAREDMVETLKKAGFREVKYKTFGLGSASLYKTRK